MNSYRVFRMAALLFVAVRISFWVKALSALRCGGFFYGYDAYKKSALQELLRRLKFPTKTYQ